MTEFLEPSWQTAIDLTGGNVIWDATRPSGNTRFTIIHLNTSLHTTVELHQNLERGLSNLVLHTI